MRFASQDTEKLPLKDDPDGTKNWVEVRKSLTVKEAKGYRTAGMTKLHPAGKGDTQATIDVDFKAMAFARALAYIVAWSDPRPFSEAALLALDEPQFDEIDTAIEAFIAKREEEKKVQSGSPGLTTVSS